MFTSSKQDRIDNTHNIREHGDCRKINVTVYGKGKNHVVQSREAANVTQYYL